MKDSQVERFWVCEGFGFGFGCWGSGGEGGEEEREV